MRFIQIFFLIILLFFLMIIYAQNIQTLQQTITLGYDLHWHAWNTPPLKLYFFLLFFFVLGAFSVFFLLVFETLRFKAQASRMKRQINKLEAEVNSLRSLPSDEAGMGSQSDEQSS